MKSIEMTAKTTEEAISAGLEQLGVSLGDVKVDILEEGSKGLFGLFGSRPAKVRLTLTEEDTADEVHEIFANSLTRQSPKRRKRPDKAETQPPPKSPRARPKKPAAPQAQGRKPAEEKAGSPAEKKPAEKSPKKKAEPKAEKPAKAGRKASPSPRRVTPADPAGSRRPWPARHRISWAM